jgi:FlaA1/EpsC-like NDP-sugar epimerase
MGEQLKVYDLAKKLIHLSGRNIASEPGGEGIEIIEIGLRPGEKMYEELLISGDQLPTDNSKIFMSKELFPNEDVMKKLIDDIKKAISNNDTKAIKDIFKSNVEGYINENS